MIRVIFSIIVIIGVLILAMANKESIQINYLFGVTPPLPLYLILITTFVIGGVVFTIILLPAWIKDKLEIRKLQRTLQKLETQKSET
ncbi:MAG: hypothetical protein A2Y48_02230 [Nitrospirae bacterium RIFCSPLOW2_12_42_9]|nr:MAG: hypothetical protein A2035_06115 [Nitrospirae bacterium GWA2_42_11]OGW62919.1 MAG: hypothetical protein A2Y48_02230 [Nitrospirae bacterium RIFCSPLOW2_12_42_9]HAS16759.1 hypothetical protein [Nitrospiraceae bacterium]